MTAASFSLPLSPGSSSGQAPILSHEGRGSGSVPSPEIRKRTSPPPWWGRARERGTRRPASIALLCLTLAAPAHTATVSELTSRATQARTQADALERGDWNAEAKLQAIQLIGPVALEFIALPNLAGEVKTDAGRRAVRRVYDLLHAPLNDIYQASFGRLDRMTKDVIERDGDLEALYDSQAYLGEQGVASRALYFLNWLNYIGSFTFQDTEKKNALLTAAMNGFGEFAVGEHASKLKNESLFGRALSERELQKFDWAIRDFELLLQQPGLTTQMMRKAQHALDQTRRYADRADRTPPSPDALAQARFQQAKAIAKQSRNATGQKRRTLRGQLLGLLLELRKAGGKWKDRAQALADAELDREEALALVEQEFPFPPWLEAKAHMQKRRFAKAVPLLEAVLASDDPNAAVFKADAEYYLGVGLYEQRRYRRAMAQFDAVLNANGRTSHAADATYFRFKAAESLYAGNQSEANAKRYVQAIDDFIRGYPKHRSIYEAHFRLGEYRQERGDYLAAAAAYDKIRGAPAFRVRADYATLQSYFEVLHAIEDGDTGLSEADVRARIGRSLDAYWKHSARLAERSPKLARRAPYDEYPGKVSVMHAVHLSHDMDANAERIVSLLSGFEEQYPKQPEAFETVARTRLVALQKTGRYEELERDVEKMFDRFLPETRTELVTGLDGILEKDIRTLRRAGDTANEQAAKRTLARLHEAWLENGGEFAEDESPDRFRYDLAQLYLDTRQYEKAEAIYTRLEQDQGPYSIVSTVGLARIAEARGDTERALSLWQAMLQHTQVGEPLWFRGTFEAARLNDTTGDPDQACKTVNGAQKMLNRLGDRNLKAKIQALASQTCGA